MRIGIIGGAGAVGSTAAFCLASMNIVKEITLMDIKDNIAKSHAMDISQIIATKSSTLIKAGGISDLGDFDIIIVSASVPETNVKSRDEYLINNSNILSKVADDIKKYSPKSIIINASNPVDVFNYYFYNHLKSNRKKYIGFSYNDTLRLKLAISEILNLNYREIEFFCAGEHGLKQVPLFSTLKVNNEKYLLSNKEKKLVETVIHEWFEKYQNLKSGRTTGWTSGYNLARYVKAIAGDSDEIVTCSAVLSGEYGISNISIGVPVKVGRDGIKEIPVLKINEKEKELLFEAANKIAIQYETIKDL